MKPVNSGLPASGGECITTIVADDSPCFLHSFCHYLRTEPETAIVGTACDGFEAIDLVRRMRPRLVVMDYHMPGLPGDQATAWIAEHFPETHVLLVSSDERPDFVPASGGGTCAFMCKKDLLFELPLLLERWFRQPRLAPSCS
jgi:DNA-binding NarL/FixJ family response regulator